MKKNRTIEVTVKRFPNEECEVLNYNRRPKVWEAGIVDILKTYIRPGGLSHRNQYRVRLHRKSAKGNYLFLTVGDDGIR